MHLCPKCNEPCDCSGDLTDVTNEAPDACECECELWDDMNAELDCNYMGDDFDMECAPWRTR